MIRYPKFSLTLLYFASSLCIIYELTSVNLEITPEDEKTFKLVPALSQCQNSIGSTEAIVSCVSKVQSWLFEKIPNKTCIEPAPFEMQPTEVLENKMGCCYGRSAFIGKFLQYAGLEIRHVGVWMRKPRPPLNLLKRKTPSHSILEVKTPDGWMLIGTISKYLGYDSHGHILNTKQFRDQELFGDETLEFPRINGKGDFSILYGIYSRHGYFYKPFVPLPDIAWSQFLLNFLDNSL
ncbi:MAG: hypothetical protein JWQ35_2245 [Bacteriovoracaceae bacterium]|nr:hypothetical protein [Bacteriovoracaceae bacterium]